MQLLLCLVSVMSHVNDAFRYINVFATEGEWGDLVAVADWPQGGLIKVLEKLRVVTQVGALRAADAGRRLQCAGGGSGNRLEARYIAFMENK